MPEFEDAFRSALGFDKPEEETGKEEEVKEEIDTEEEVDETKSEEVSEEDKVEDKQEDKTEEKVEDKKVLLNDDKDTHTESVDFDKYLLEKSGGKFKSYTDIEKALEEAPQNAFANETVAKLNDYVRSGGKPEDFLKTQTTDYGTMDDVTAIKEWMALTKKGLSGEDIDFLVQNKYGVSESATESEKRLAKIEMKTAANEAKEALMENQKKWAVPESADRVSDEDIQKERERWSKTLADETEKFGGLEFEVGDEKFKYDIEASDKKSLVENHKDLSKFFTRYRNDDGTENVQKFIKEMYILNNFDKIAKALTVYAKGKGTQEIVDDIKNPDFKGTDTKGTTDGKRSVLDQVGDVILGS